MYIASLDTYNVEKWKTFLELKFCEPGGVDSGPCALNLDSLKVS